MQQQLGDVWIKSFCAALSICVDSAGEEKDMRALLWEHNGVICKRYTGFLVDLYVEFPEF